jgi:hypothetical protein
LSSVVFPLPRKPVMTVTGVVMRTMIDLPAGEVGGKSGRTAHG